MKPVTSITNGAIIWEGPSLHDGSPIVVIVTWESQNAKTGPMAQTWIIRQDIAPVEARKQGKDDAICMSCPLKSGEGCYVVVSQGPTAVFKTYKGLPIRNVGGVDIFSTPYIRMTPAQAGEVVELEASKAVRLGSYGDPSSVPSYVWEELLGSMRTFGSRNHTGYTHDWRNQEERKGYLMASVDSEEERIEAKAKGWRTFRTALPGDKPMKGEIFCPASEEGGDSRTCLTCRACFGNPSDKGSDILIYLHGSSSTLVKAIKATNRFEAWKALATK